MKILFLYSFADDSILLSFWNSTLHIPAKKKCNSYRHGLIFVVISKLLWYLNVSICCVFYYLCVVEIVFLSV